MSVPLSQRKESLLLVITKSADLFRYCMRVCNNQKNFPKRYRWIAVDPILKLVMMAYQGFVCANSIFIVNQQTYNKRRELQSDGMSLMATLIGQLELCFSSFHVPVKKINFLLAKSGELISLVRKWQKSDELRYPEFAKNFVEGYDISSFTSLATRIHAANDKNSFLANMNFQESMAILDIICNEPQNGEQENKEENKENLVSQGLPC